MALVTKSNERQQYRYYFRLDQTCVYIHNQQQYNDKVLLKYAMEYLSCEVSVVVFYNLLYFLQQGTYQEIHQSINQEDPPQAFA